MSTFPEQYVKRIEYVQKMKKRGQEIGPAGVFYVAVCDDLIRRAMKAATEHDTVAMLSIYKEMEEIN